MMMADTMDALGLAGKYVVKVNNRKVLGRGAAPCSAWPTTTRSSSVMRAIDKLDQVRHSRASHCCSATGRKDESGDFTEGAKLTASQMIEF